MLGKSKKRVLIRLILLAMPTIVILAVAIVAMFVHRSTKFELDLKGLTVSFVPFKSGSVQLMERTPFSNLTMHGIDSAVFTQARFTPTDKSVPGSFLSSDSGEIQIVKQQPCGADINISSPKNNASEIGNIEPLFLPPETRVYLRVFNEEQAPAEISTTICNRPSRIILSISRRSMVDFVHAGIHTSNSNNSKPVSGTIFIMQPKEGNALVRVDATSIADAPTVMLEPVSDVVFASNFPVAELNFMPSKTVDTPGSTIDVEGTLHFVNVEDKHDINVRRGDFLKLEKLEKFYISGMTFDFRDKVFHIKAAGYVGSLKHGPSGNIQEHTVTWFDSIWHQSWSMNLFAIAVWMVATILSAYRLRQELRK